MEIITEKTTEETVLQKLLNSIINLSFRFMCFSFKFVTYLVISFIQIIVDFIYERMDFENWDFLRQREEQKLFDIEVDEDDVNYKYRIVRSNEYANLYNDIKDFLINISDGEQAVDRKSTRLNSSHSRKSRMPSSA